MNEELEQLIQELKSTLPWFLAAGIIVAGYYGVRKYVADRRAAASEIVSTAYTTDELEDAVAKFGSSKSGGILRLRLAKSYFDAGSYESALDIYSELEGKAPDGFADVPAVGKAQCREARLRALRCAGRKPRQGARGARGAEGGRCGRRDREVAHRDDDRPRQALREARGSLALRRRGRRAEAD